MGYLHASEFAEQSSLREAVVWHLCSNHYPPLPLSCVPVAIRAIRHTKWGEWNKLLRLPSGVQWRGHTTVPVSECVSGWHLEAFIDHGR